MTKTEPATLYVLADLDSVMRAVETVGAYVIGAIRRETANLRAERATGLSKLGWQRASGPQATGMLATGHFPAPTKAVHVGTAMDAEASFATGLDRVLDRDRPGPCPRRRGRQARPAVGVTLASYRRGRHAHPATGGRSLGSSAVTANLTRPPT